MSLVCRSVAVASAVLAACCGGTQGKTAPKATGVLAAPTYEVVSSEVEFLVGERPVTGTVTRPEAPGKYPAVVMHAGSGPTDRDWNSPAMPGKNGSGKLLAEKLTRHGAVVLRFDKQGTGGTPLPAEITWAGFVGDFKGAVDFLRAAIYVNASRIFIAGHSEGGLHAIRLAMESRGEVAGLMLLAAPGRAMRDVILGQLEDQFRDLAGLEGAALEAEMTPIRDGLATFFAGGEVDPAKVSSHVPVQQLVAAIVHPKGAAFARELYAFDPTEGIAEVKVPILILNGEKDIQVSPEKDAKRLKEPATLGSGDVTLHLSPDADHVLKHEEMPKAEILKPENRAQLPFRYNADDRVLDPDASGAIVEWLAAHTASK